MLIKWPGARKFRGESAAFGDRPASKMSKYSPAWTLNSEMVPFRSSWWRQACRSMQVNIYTGLIAPTDLWPQRCFSICLQWSCLKAISVPTFVLGGLRGSTATSGSCLGVLNFLLQVKQDQGSQLCSVGKRFPALYYFLQSLQQEGWLDMICDQGDLRRSYHSQKSLLKISKQVNIGCGENLSSLRKRRTERLSKSWIDSFASQSGLIRKGARNECQNKLSHSRTSVASRKAGRSGGKITGLVLFFFEVCSVYFVSTLFAWKGCGERQLWGQFFYYYFGSLHCRKNNWLTMKSCCSSVWQLARTSLQKLIKKGGGGKMLSLRSAFWSEQELGRKVSSDNSVFPRRKWAP